MHVICSTCWILYKQPVVGHAVYVGARCCWCGTTPAWPTIYSDWRKCQDVHLEDVTL